MIWLGTASIDGTFVGSSCNTGGGGSSFPRKCRNLIVTREVHPLNSVEYASASTMRNVFMSESRVAEGTVKEEANEPVNRMVNTGAPTRR